jgi:GNAT superfamily N-acetyltransferase
MHPYRISHAHDDMQMEVIHGFLSRAYWSPGIPREVVEKAARHSLVAGAFHASGAQVGFARLITDHTTFGYLADVFVLEGHRGQGLARAMTRSFLELPEVKGFRTVLLATRDAHGVYEACGFERVIEPGLYMRIPRVSPCEASADGNVGSKNC